ncbi:hypothetical protein OPT61_g5789 [Boeremia exigua]|uniref:Uncharacterized protein n=1 Tax=Boeremia exigua TaxID=749465 RepID=A0ACC2I918_9PLEO|nr:hypothetical protein OPT61_g5789 [Boeremia exigua]
MSSATKGSSATSNIHRSRPRISSFDPEFITILVGPQKKRFVVHKSVLIHHSSYFRAALTGNFKEASDMVVELKEECEITFEIFVHWLYYRALPNKYLDDQSVADLFCGDAGYPDNQMIVKLYVAGDQYDVAGLRRDALDLIISLADVVEVPGFLVRMPLIMHSIICRQQTLCVVF